MELQKRRRGNILKIPLLIILSLIVIGLAVVFGLFHIRTVDIVGNEFYSAEEIERMVMSDSMAGNSLYLMWKYSDPENAESLPFLSAIEVSLVTPYHVQIRVYEKTIAGYLMSSGSMVYFDTDGMVVEVSGEQRDGIVPYSGITISTPTVGEALPVDDNAFFNKIVESSRMIHQSELVPDEVHFDDKQELVVYFGTNRVMLGDDSYLEEKLLELRNIYPQMEGLSGTLHMENFTPDTTAVSFRKGERGEGEEELMISTNGVILGVEEGNGENADNAGNRTRNPVGANGSGYVEDESRFSVDADGNEVYIDELGNVTPNLDMPYLGEDGNIISDGYGYIDPYTGAYILND